MRSPRFWLTHAVLPGVLVAVVLTGIAWQHLDIRIADALFYDASSGRWLGAGTWWADSLIHDGGRNAVRFIGVAALLALGASYLRPRYRPWRRTAAFVVLSLVLSTGLAGLVKRTSNVDCPWDLEHFGGTRPYVTLFGDRPDTLSAAGCFPGAHSSSGFALLCFYFLLRDRSSRAALWALACGLGVGATFAFGQEARGAHFLSHDLTSAALVWGILLILYVTALAPRRTMRLISSAPNVSPVERSYEYRSHGRGRKGAGAAHAGRR